MRSFRDLPLKQKLLLSMMATSVAALMLGTGIMGFYDTIRIRQAMVREFSTEADIIGSYVAGAVASRDAKAAEQILNDLRSRPEIVFACVYGTNGALLAQAVGREGHQKYIPRTSEASGHRFVEGHLVLYRPVILRSSLVGFICLGADPITQSAALRAHSILLVVVLLASLLVAMLLSMRLRRFISDPILALTGVVRAVTERKDYSLRAAQQGADELGELIDGFNQMLAQIQQRDAELRASEERFRQVTESIREVFWVSDIEKNQMIYVSPGYEEIWGRPCDSLYATPRSWVEAIHPDHREQVLQAAVTQQATGEYDEQYRILRPDGTIRWIRDRAFPVRNDQGAVYRIAGIAEDITERKELEAEILEISGREQARIAHDLHDGLCQHLVSIAFASRGLEQELARHSRPEADLACEISDLLDQAITQARRLAHGLHPVRLEAEGLGVALQELAGAVRGNSVMACELDYPNPVLVNDLAVATHLYRIAQEAVNNALHHSHAKAIRLRLTADAEEIHLAVSDDGVGLPDRPAPSRGMGLHIMRYRAQMIGGRLQVQRGPNGGTMISCFCPRKVDH